MIEGLNNLDAIKDTVYAASLNSHHWWKKSIPNAW